MKITARPETVGLSRDRLARLDDWMKRYVDAGKLPGMMTAIARRGEVVDWRMYGHADVEAGRKLADDTIFRIYSMTKPITSVGIMMLFERGLFQLADPIHRWLPAFKDMQVYKGGDAKSWQGEPAKEPITFRHLLTHTSGLSYGFIADSPVAPIYAANKVEFNPGRGSLAAMVDRLATMPLLCEPGAEWNYSNATDVLGRLIEVISGESLPDYFEKHILGPLGMTDTAFHVAEDKAGRFAALYEPTEAKDGIRLIDAPGKSHYLKPPETPSGGGGLAGTIGDYMRFALMMANKGELDGVRLLGRKTVEYMTGNHLGGDMAAMGQPRFSEVSYEGIGFGLGFSVALDPAKAQVIGSPGEYGWGGAASTSYWHDPVEQISCVFMTQLRPSSTYPLRPELRTLVQQAIID
jgi:CubicO group peptidase (beta-lactamase class C family)